MLTLNIKTAEGDEQETLTLNPEQIESVRPDADGAIVTMVSGRSFAVLETVEEIEDALDLKIDKPRPHTAKKPVAKHK